MIACEWLLATDECNAMGREHALEADLAINGNTDLGFSIVDPVYPDHMEHLPVKVVFTAICRVLCAWLARCFALTQTLPWGGGEGGDVPPESSASW